MKTSPAPDRIRSLVLPPCFSALRVQSSVSEAWGGNHFDAAHGLNVEAGIFGSYIGLFSYYNFDNWTYQPSFVSSNTPWFFNDLRIQYFPTKKLKIEPWINENGGDRAQMREGTITLPSSTRPCSSFTASCPA